MRSVRARLTLRRQTLYSDLRWHARVNQQNLSRQHYRHYYNHPETL